MDLEKFYFTYGSDDVLRRMDGGLGAKLPHGVSGVPGSPP